METTSPVDVASLQLTRARAVTLLTELLQGFSRKTFQRKLDKLVLKHIEPTTEPTEPTAEPIRHLDGRRELAFRVQSEILARHGFSVDESGILAMKSAIRAHLGDPEIAEKSKAVRLKLRLPLMQLPESNEFADWTFAELPAPTPSALSPPVSCAVPSPPVLERMEPKVRDVLIKVTNPLDQSMMTVTVQKLGTQFPTVHAVKAAIIAQLGDGGSVDSSSFRIVISNGAGGYGTRNDTETVRLNRVLAVGVRIFAAEA